MADSELQPAKKKGCFLPAWMEEFTWLKEENEKTYSDICKMTVKKTVSQQLAVTIIRRVPKFERSHYDYQ